MPSKRVTRRTFLKGAAVAAGPFIVPSSAFAAPGRPAPSDRLAIGCIGIGGNGGGHLGRYLGRRDTQVLAVCDVDSEKRDAAQQRANKKYADLMGKGSYKGPDAYNDFRDLVARDDVDAVTVSTPDHWHAIVSIAAVKSGKDVYCEKPLSLTIGEARAMVNATRRYGRVFQTGSQQRSGYAGRFRFACEMIRNGRLGKLQTAHVTVGGPSKDCYLPAEPTPEGLDWDMWIGPAPWRPYHHRIHPASWRSFRDYSGGGMTDWGAHHFDIVQWALDMDNSGPVEIYPPDGKEHQRLTYVYANGVRVYHGGHTGKGSGITFIGTEGKIEVSRDTLTTYPASIMAEPTGPGEVHLYESKDHAGNWLECIRTRRRPVCDVAIGCRSVTVCHLGNLAYWLKRPLKWDPAAERFVGDEMANRWLDRPKRAPWRLG